MFWEIAELPGQAGTARTGVALSQPAERRPWSHDQEGSILARCPTTLGPCATI